MTYRVKSIEPSDWQVIERLFGANGACGGCWCMYWRLPSTGKIFEQSKGEINRASFRDLIMSGQAKGILAFVEDEPVGWASVGLRQSFDYLRRSNNIAPLAAEKKTWCVTCFFVAASWRNRGVANALLDGAIKEAKSRGADLLEGYPTAKKNKLVPAAFAHTGLPEMFETAQFEAIMQHGSRITYRLAL